MRSRVVRRALVQATRSLGLAVDDTTTIVERRCKICIHGNRKAYKLCVSVLGIAMASEEDSHPSEEATT